MGGRENSDLQFLVTGDPDRVDVDAVVGYLSSEVPWGRWRSPEEIRRQILGAWRVVCAVEEGSGRTVGFARAVSDGVSLAYLADVYVEAPYRGMGLASRILEEMIENGAGRRFRWLLHADEAEGLYARFGFEVPRGRLMEREHPPPGPDPVILGPSHT